MRQTRFLPFYMTYPMPLFYQEQDTVSKDLEYLQEMYPVEAKRYQKVIAEVLDRLDYEGSMIYDEYPDRWQIYRLTQFIVDKLKQQKNAVPVSGGSNDKYSEDTKDIMEDEDWNQTAQFVQVLLCYEIYKKRHTNRNGILKF